jgi:phytoene dehydrogenase-like protein
MKPTIIGAGISGLSAGLHLHRKGFTVKIIEASDRVVAELKPM